ncbi:hypothetical protein DSO57_1009751 [Entomophthora muscae]|uniref:Uncharacterized protein n=1 Tax=Entomophthora muscae TaxID=34485 RepID=A0ACC2RLD2_9FUNG|nr:hypothetical protein DSO57_1009751 [Entomophthora muscae]
MLDPFELTFYLCLGLALICFVLSYATDNYSYVDKLWSITPMLYTWIYWGYGVAIDPIGSKRLTVFTFLITLWGFRLTANFYRKGGYSLKDEDYRWVYVRKMIGDSRGLKFQLFNLGFISLFQHILLWSLTLPVYCSLLAVGKPFAEWKFLDSFATLWVLFFWGIELIADGQQFAFQCKKKKLLKENPAAVPKQFITDGLFGYCRHPNFTAEQAIWIGIALLGQTSCQSYSSLGIPALEYLNPNWFGVTALLILFHNSTKLTEDITLSRYSEYSKYQETTNCFIPSVKTLIFGPPKASALKRD